MSSPARCLTRIPGAVLGARGSSPGRALCAAAILVLAALSFPGAAHADFGLHSFDAGAENADGTIDTQAGSHPYAYSTRLTVNQEVDPHTGQSIPQGSLRDLEIELPPGLIGNPTATPKCGIQLFVTIDDGGNACPDDTAVGFATTEVAGTTPYVSPVYNLEASPGRPASFGFVVISTPVFFSANVRGEGDYGITASLSNISQVLRIDGAAVTLWGVPADPAHDLHRGRCEGQFGEPKGRCPSGLVPTPFLTLPTSCEGPLTTTAHATGWDLPQEPGSVLGSVSRDPGGDPVGLDGCDRLPFEPRAAATPTTDRASAPTGLDFSLDVEDPGLESAGALAQSDIEKAVVTLPEGVSVNPSAGAGLGVCTPSQYASETVDSEAGTGCPEDSKIGDVRIETPLLEQPVPGSLYVAEPDDPATSRPGAENPFDSLLALYVVGKDPATGILVKIAGKVTPNPQTGQLQTTFENLPQLPFSHFELSFRQGQRSPLISPSTCGTFTTETDLTPYSEPQAVLHEQSSFTIDKNFEGGACPSGTPPFHPQVSAGTLNNAAGSYSPFYLRMTRTDGEQEITHFSSILPKGLVGKLAGLSKCSDAAIAAAESPQRTGAQEEAHPSCPASSLIGSTEVGTGVGSVLAYAPGKLYLAGPYHGSPISIAAITAAKVGPFDLGTVVVRSALRVDPLTAQVSVDGAGSDPIPHIIDGIPVHLRDIRVSVDRPEFTLNPTSCDPMQISSTLLGSGADFASSADDVPVTGTDPFQAAGCSGLGFRPGLSLTLAGGHGRHAFPALTARVTYPQGAYANIAQARVSLPPSEFLEQGHIRTTCTRVQFSAGAGNGEECPPASIYGHARAVTPLLEAPLEGPVYLRSNGGERRLPDLVAALHGEDFDIDLVGFVDSVHRKGSEASRIRNSFDLVPDAPVSSFTLSLEGGRKGLLVNSTDICKGTHRVDAKFVGQNGKTEEIHPPLNAGCGRSDEKPRHHRRHR